MNSNIFKVNIKDVLNSAVFAVIMAMLKFLQNVTSIYEIDFMQLLNVSVLAFISALFTSFMTTSDGKAFGLIKVK